MNKQQFIRRCIKQLNLMVVNHFDGTTELMDRSGQSDYHKVFNDDWGRNGWDARYKEVAFNVELARKNNSNW